MQIETKRIPTVRLWPNSGQISGLPKNPRFIRDDRFEKLVQSIKDDPEMLDLRELIVTPYAGDYVVIAGNMRLRAAIEVAGISEDELAELIEKKQNLDNFNTWLEAIGKLRKEKAMPCKILPIETPIEQLKAITIKDNVAFGSNDYDLLSSEWDEVDLLNWGMEIPDFDGEGMEEEKEKGPSVVRLTIEFEELADYDTVKVEIEDLLERYPGARLKN